MGCEVYANGMTIACKVADGKTIAAMPDVCLSPPTPPAGPVPIPYPNTAMASDTTKGSKTVQIGGKEVMLKRNSTFKKSTGDEAATKTLGMGVVSHQIQGEVNFCAWSMDVKFEGENVPRNLDLTLHNEMCDPANTPPWPYIDSMAAGTGEDPCEEEKEREQSACGRRSRTEQCADPDCQDAQKCRLVPYGGSGSPNCCRGQTGHHMIEDHWVKNNPAFPWYRSLRDGNPPPTAAERASGVRTENDAPTVCCEGTRYNMDHGEMHAAQGLIEEAHMPGGSMANHPWNYGEGKFATTTAHNMTFPAAECSRECLDAQMDAFYGGDNSRPLNPPTRQNIAVNDTQNDGRWLRDAATEAMAALRSGG